MNILSELLNDNIIKALGWNIFNILWQGFIIAIILSLVLRILKGKSSQLRYLISMISLLLIMGFSIFNFINNYDKNTSNSISYIDNNQANESNLLLIDFNDIKINKSSIELITLFKDRLISVDKYFPLIVNVWILGVFIFILKFVLSFFYTCRLRKINTKNISEEWLDKFLKLQEQLRINRTVSYIESQLVKIPLVLGYLKPVVVIPVELLSGMPLNQIEAVIAHELAHIRRNDYIFNVFQTIIETLFFFHPAIWYISSQIRKERENCCDDMALTVCEGSLVYAKALVSVQEFTLNRHYSAVAFSGRKKHLLNRIKRMIMKQKVKSNISDKIIAALIILSSVIALSFTYKANTANSISESVFKTDINRPVESLTAKLPISEAIKLKDVQELKAVEQDTVKKKKHHHEGIDIENNTVTKTFRDDTGKKKEMEFTLDNGTVTKLLINGKEIPKNDYDKYQPEIDETIASIKDAKIDIRNAMKEIEEIDIDKIQLEIEEAMKNAHVNLAEIQEDIARAMEDVKKTNYEDLKKEIEINLEELKDMDFDFDIDIDLEDFNIDVEGIRAEIERAHEEMKEHVNVEVIQKEMLKVQEELSKINSEELKIQMEESLKHFEEFDKKETMKDLEEKLEELENLELEKK
jgi:beta-lactamase regulating signal transducer with metallopeptidase domain